MEGESKRNITFRIFLGVVFLALVMYIAFWLYGIVSESVVGHKGLTGENETSNVFSCFEYAFNVYAIEYDGEMLTFDFKNEELSSYDINNIQLVSDTGDKETIAVKRFKPGMEKSFHVEININNTFEIYPETCDIYLQTYQINTGKAV